MAMLRTRMRVEHALGSGCDRLRARAAADSPRRQLPLRRISTQAGGALDWATPQTISDFPDLDGRRDYDYDGSDFEDDGQ